MVRLNRRRNWAAKIIENSDSVRLAVAGLPGPLSIHIVNKIAYRLTSLRLFSHKTSIDRQFPLMHNDHYGHNG
jgi:hypothetical protein